MTYMGMNFFLVGHYTFDYSVKLILIGNQRFGRILCHFHHHLCCLQSARIPSFWCAGICFYSRCLCTFLTHVHTEKYNLSLMSYQCLRIRENYYDFFQLEEFSTLETSAYTLFRMILGDFNFKNIETASPLFGVVFFLSYIFFVFFVLLVSFFEKHKRKLL